MAKHVIDYIRQPETLDAQSISHLRSMVERYPYYHAARLLMLKGLYDQHDSTFDEELRRAAIYLPSRKTLFHMFQAESSKPLSPVRRESKAEKEGSTVALIDSFLSTLPEQQQPRSSHVIDSTTDYMAYLLQTSGESQSPGSDMMGQQLIDNFLNENDGKFHIEDLPQEEILTPDIQDTNEGEGGYLTETLARIYIKQGKFDKAIEIIQRLSLKYPKKNRYFADQIRFLDKLIINQRAKS